MRFLLAVPALLALLTLFACSEEADEAQVDIVIKEWSIEPDVDEVAGGDVRFDLKNEGPDQDHEMLIIRTDFDPGDLPVEDDGSVDESAAGVNVIGSISDFEPDQRSSGTFTLTPGPYVLICNLVSDVDGEETSHYQKGMRVALTATD